MTPPLALVAPLTSQHKVAQFIHAATCQGDDVVDLSGDVNPSSGASVAASRPCQADCGLAVMTTTKGCAARHSPCCTRESAPVRLTHFWAAHRDAASRLTLPSASSDQM